MMDGKVESKVLDLVQFRVAATHRHHMEGGTGLLLRNFIVEQALKKR